MSGPDLSNPSVSNLLVDLRARRRRVNAMRWSLHGLLVGAVVGCAASAIFWATANPGIATLAIAGAASMAALGVVGAVVGWILPVNDLDVARALDRAAGSDDRFASAVQLAGNHHRERARLVVEDAVGRVKQTSAAAAMPLRMPRTARWIPLPVIVLAALVVLLPSGRTQAVSPGEPEITADEWAQIHDAFRKEIDQMPKPLTPEEEEMQKQFEKLAAMLKENPEKKEALREIARLSERVEQQKRSMGSKANSMKSAAKAISSSQALKQFARTLKDGQYNQAANELRKLSDKLQKGEQKPDAAEMEAMASDLQKMADQISKEEIQEAARKCSGAASSMNREELAKALKRLAEEMEKNAEMCRKCDKAGDYESLLEQLKRMMSQCKGGSCEGDGLCENPGDRPGGRGKGKGGKKAGWGSAAKWDGGSIKKSDEQRTPELSDAIENKGTNTTFQITSPDERAKSELKYKELFAEFVQKSEADLDLDSVPVAQREFLRRYFNAIRPQEAPPAMPGAGESEKPANP